MFGNVPRELPQRIALVLLQRFSFLPFSGLVESFRLANRMSGRELYRWTLTSMDGQPVTASNGVELNVGGDLTAAEASDTVVRSEEHTSELQSLMRTSYAVFCLKKKTHKSMKL